MNDDVSPDRELLFRFLDGRDRGCPGCGYNLRDLRSEACPECGQQLTLSLRLVEPRQGALIAGLVGLASGAGMGGLMLAFAAIMILVYRQSTGALGEFLLVNGVGFAVHGLGLVLWIRNWNKLRTVSAGVRRMLIVLCWAMPLVFVAVFAANIR